MADFKSGLSGLEAGRPSMPQVKRSSSEALFKRSAPQAQRSLELGSDHSGQIDHAVRVSGFIVVP